MKVVWNAVYFCFYSTYEELKHFDGDDIVYTAGVFTVPMRNWNIASKSCFILSYTCFYSTYEELKLENVNEVEEAMIKFLQYLWGIETLLWN